MQNFLQKLPILVLTKTLWVPRSGFGFKNIVRDGMGFCWVWLRLVTSLLTIVKNSLI